MHLLIKKPYPPNLDIDKIIVDLDDFEIEIDKRDVN